MHQTLEDNVDMIRFLAVLEIEAVVAAVVQVDAKAGRGLEAEACAFCKK